MDSSNEQEVTIDLDSSSDVLYVRRSEKRLVTSRSCDDDCVVLNIDTEGQVSGVQIIFVSEICANWSSHPDRIHIPSDLLQKVDDAIDAIMTCKAWVKTMVSFGHRLGK